MWIDSHGVCNTVALPEPTSVMTAAFRASLDRLIASAKEAVLDLIEAEESRFYAEISARGLNQAGETEYVGIPVPEVLTEPVRTIGDLQSVICRVDQRWRLDALMALNDHVSE